MNNIRKLALLLLCDEHGIPSDAWDELRFMLERKDGNEDIILGVRAQDGRFYLPEGWRERK